MGPSRTLVVVAVVVLVLAGAVALALTARPSGTTPSTTSSTTQGGTPTGERSPGTQWTTYHGDNARTGFVQEAAVANASLSWRSSPLDGAVYAEPLLFGGVLYVATENNSLYALNATTGAVVWRLHFGQPVDGSTLPCGNINPSGVTGTPVIDPTSGTIYLVAFEAPAHHVLYAVSASSGAVKFSVRVDPPGADPQVEQERAALSLSNGMVYVPYGGLAGDCGDYHGWVVGVHADGTQGMVSYEVPTDREGGIWAPSGAAADARGDLYVTTGNGNSNGAFDHGNSVIELSPNLTEVAYFAPVNWAALNSQDADLGSVGPALVNGSGVFQIGKEGVGYLLNATRLGGIGGEVTSLQVCNSAFGGTAYDGSSVFVACSDGLHQVSVAGGTLGAGWEAAGFSAGPPVVAGGVVWSVDASAGHLLGFSSATGSQLFKFSIGSTNRFTTPTVASGAVYVASGDVVYAYATS